MEYVTSILDGSKIKEPAILVDMKGPILKIGSIDLCKETYWIYYEKYYQSIKRETNESVLKVYKELINSLKVIRLPLNQELFDKVSSCIEYHRTEEFLNKYGDIEIL